jgi:hypothetical protein
MNNQRSVLTLENFLYLAFFGLALTLRLYHLNAHPLNEPEAHEAMLAYRLVHGQVAAGLPASPAYLFFTYFGFLLFGASDAIARLAPALFGAGLVLLPLFFREELGREVTLATSGLLAVSAALLAASRSADGALIAFVALVVGVAAFRKYLAADSSSVWLIVSAIALGLGLVSGGVFLTGLLILALTAAIAAWGDLAERESLQSAWARLRAQIRLFLIPLALTALIVSTIGSLYRPGLGAWFNSWAMWGTGFIPSTASRTPLTFIIFLLAYEPLIFVFGVIGGVRAFRSGHRLGQWLAWFSLIALTFTLLYGGRTLFQMIWIIAPLSVLAAQAIIELLGGEWVMDERPLVAAQVGVGAVLLVFAALNVASFAEQVRTNPNITAQGQFSFLGMNFSNSPWTSLGMSGLTIVLMLVISYLFGMGWSPQSATRGLVLTVFLALVIMSMSAAWGLTQLRPDSPVELWWEQPVADGLNSLVGILKNTSNFSVGSEHDVELVVQGSPDGVLGWALRDYTHTSFVDQLDPLVKSQVVIAPEGQDNPTLGSAYVGEAFAWRHTWTPQALTWPEWIGWVAFRRAPVQSEHMILWVRQDVQQLVSTQ